MSNVLVTGANGYIGTCVVAELQKRGYQVVACDVAFTNLPSNVDKLAANIFDPDADIYDLAGQPDCLIHLAWRNGFQHNADTHLQDLPHHFDFLKKMVEAGCKKLSVMGSMHEVGYWEGAITADAPTNPLSFYGIAKNTLRQALEVFTKDKDVSFHWLRGYYIYGNDAKSSSVLGKLLEADKQGKALFPFTSGKNLYDYISVEELARQIVAASVQTKYTGIINCCSGVPISLSEMAEKFIRDNGLTIKLQYGAFPDRPYDSPGVWGDATLIQKIMAECEE